MATVRWHLDELSGSTLTLRLYPLTSGSIANGVGGDAMTESGDGLFSATVAESLSGWHAAYADRSGVPVAKGWVNMDSATPVVVETIAAASSEGASGSGSVLYTHEVVDDDSNPLDGVEVWVTTQDTDPNSGVVAGTKTTDALGTVQFMLDPGTYYFWHQLSGYDFPTDPVEEVVS